MKKVSGILSEDAAAKGDPPMAPLHGWQATPTTTAQAMLDAAFNAAQKSGASLPAMPSAVLAPDMEFKSFI
eukprot:2210041-Karenia_brevis.AAC.1